MHPLDVIGEPVRRRVLELLADNVLTAGSVGAVVQREFGISQPAVSAHLKVLREAGFVTVRVQGAKRLYAVEVAPLRDVDAWLEQFRRLWAQPLDALATEIARGRRGQRSETAPSSAKRRRRAQ